MLEAFIIERINREKKKEQRERAPLYIDRPPVASHAKKENKEQRGVAIIDFTI